MDVHLYSCLPLFTLSILKTKMELLKLLSFRISVDQEYANGRKFSIIYPLIEHLGFIFI